MLYQEVTLMYAVIKATDPITMFRNCNAKEAALITVQLEKDKAPASDRSLITAVAMDDGGYADFLF